MLTYKAIRTYAAMFTASIHTNTFTQRLLQTYKRTCTLGSLLTEAVGSSDPTVGIHPVPLYLASHPCL